jgi:hypothetical protein
MLFEILSPTSSTFDIAYRVSLFSTGMNRGRSGISHGAREPLALGGAVPEAADFTVNISLMLATEGSLPAIQSMKI